MHTLSVAAPPDPVSLAARVRPLGDVAVLWSATGGGASYVAAGAVESSRDLVPPREPVPGSAVPRWVGLLPYEAARSLERPSWTPREHRPRPHHERPAWRRYDAVLRVDHATGAVSSVGVDRARVAELASRAAVPVEALPAKVGGLVPSNSEEHRARIARALERIGEGQVYQICLARRFEGRVEGELSSVLARLVEAFPTQYAFFCDFNGEAAVISTSPELFLRVDGRRVLTRPIKGTRARGRDAAADDEERALLDRDPKERAELAMIVDLERSDLGRISESGSVRVSRGPEVETHATLHHRVAEIEATLRADVSLSDVVRATWPSGSVTGAPKVRAMELIAELERDRRGLYTGAMGAVMSDGSLTLAMAIRALTVRDGEAHYFAGGGIVEASDPAREVEETELKARHLSALWSG